MVGNLYILQNFTGLNEYDNELILNTHIDGQLPRLGVDEQVIYPDFNQDFTYSANSEEPLSKKVIESRGSIHYKVRKLSGLL